MIYNVELAISKQCERLKLTIAKKIIPHNSGAFRLKDFNKHDVKLDSFKTHPSKCSHE